MADPLVRMDEVLGQLDELGREAAAGRLNGTEQSTFATVATAYGVRALISELGALNENLEQIIRRMPGRSGS